MPLELLSSSSIRRYLIKCLVDSIYSLRVLELASTRFVLTFIFIAVGKSRCWLFLRVQLKDRYWQRLGSYFGWFILLD